MTSSTVRRGFSRKYGIWTGPWRIPTVIVTIADHGCYFSDSNCTATRKEMANYLRRNRRINSVRLMSKWSAQP